MTRILSAGNLEIGAYSASRGMASAGVKNIVVIAPPAPSVVSAYPSDGSTDLAHSISVTAQYVPPTFKLSDLTSAQLVTAQGNTYPVEILSVATKNKMCLHTYCSLFEVKLRAPALDETDNGGGGATFSALSKPYTLYPIPLTLYPIPYTLYPTPYTLYPSLYHLIYDPVPYIL